MAGLHPQARQEANVDALLMLLFALCTTPLVLAPHDMRLSEHEGWVPSAWPGPEGVRVMLACGESVISSDDLPVGG